MIEPTTKAIAPRANAVRRPNLSPSGAAANEPKKHPAWSNETILAANAFCVDSVASTSPKSLRKDS
jgi:hypothetical protein